MLEGILAGDFDGVDLILRDGETGRPFTGVEVADMIP